MMSAEQDDGGPQSLRDYFAAQAIAGVCTITFPDSMMREVARRAYALADALVAERRAKREEGE